MSIGVGNGCVATLETVVSIEGASGNILEFFGETAFLVLVLVGNVDYGDKINRLTHN